MPTLEGCLKSRPKTQRLLNKAERNKQKQAQWTKAVVLGFDSKGGIVSSSSVGPGGNLCLLVNSVVPIFTVSLHPSAPAMVLVLTL